MGCFDYTCGLSGLPIGPGDAIRYLLVTQNPYNRGKSAGGNTCYQNDIWFPRTFPLRGKYDWYGRADELQTGPQADAWLAGFRRDLIEKGWGDNQCHDLPTNKGMTLAGILAAVVEGRVHVRHDVDDLPGRIASETSKKKPSIPKGIPTRRRVERLLVQKGYALAKGYGEGVFVNRVDRNTVRVRAGEFGKRIERLAEIRDALASHYAGMVTSDTGNYADDAALFLSPLPGVRRFPKAKAREPGLCVAHVMIREDVWQAICGLTLRESFSQALSAEQCREMAREAWTKSVGMPDTFGRFMMRHDAFGITGDAIPFTVGLGTSWWHMVDAHKTGNLTDAEREDFVSTAGELAFIMRWMSTTRFQWHPSASCGPQHGEWKMHAALLDAYHRVALAEVEREQKERAEQEAEDAAV